MTNTTTAEPDEATIAGSTGFVLSIEWESRDYIRRALDLFVDAAVAVTVSDDSTPAFDAMIRRTDDGIVFVPWDLDADEAVKLADPVPFDTEVIDGIHVY